MRGRTTVVRDDGAQLFGGPADQLASDPVLGSETMTDAVEQRVHQIDLSGEPFGWLTWECAEDGIQRGRNMASQDAVSILGIEGAALDMHLGGVEGAEELVEMVGDEALVEARREAGWHGIGISRSEGRPSKEALGRCPGSRCTRNDGVVPDP